MKVTTQEQELWDNLHTYDWADILFEDLYSGEEYFVELPKAYEMETIDEFIDRCKQELEQNGLRAEAIQLVSQEYAESMGLDTY